MPDLKKNSLLDVFEALPLASTFLDKDLNIIKNSNFLNQIGQWQDNEFIGRPAISIIVDDDAERKKINQKIEKFKNSNDERITFYTQSLKVNDGKSFYLKINLIKVSADPIKYLWLSIPVNELRKEKLEAISEVYQYKRLEKTAKIGLWEFNIKDSCLKWSDETYAIHKLPLSDKINIEDAISFYHEEDQEKIRSLVEDCIKNGTPYLTQLRVITTQNDIIWVEARGEAIYDKSGQIIKLHGTFQDITEKTNLEYEKTASLVLARSYQDMMDSFAIVAKTDLAGRITYVNDKFCEISQYAREELIGQNHRILNSGMHGEYFWKKFWQRISSGKNFRGDICNKAKDGSLYWVDTFVSALYDEKGDINGFMAIRVDISEKKKIEDELTEEREQAAIMSQLATVGEMSAGIAHEINNPLAVISGTADMMGIKAAQKDCSGMDSKIETIKKSIERISKIIKGLKRVSHKSAKNELERYSLKEIMNDTLDFSYEVLRSKGVKLYVDDIPDTFLMCRSVEISQVMLNLINNARDAILKDEDRWIKVEAFQRQDKVRVNIIDSGSGIPKDLRAKIMQPFFTTKGVGKGTGIGLSISKKIIEEHGGEFFIDEKHKNTCFSIILPVIKS